MKVLTLVKGLSKDLRLQAMVSFATVCDTVWNHRNEIIHGGKCGDTHSLLKEVWRKFVDFGGDKVGEVSDSRGKGKNKEESEGRLLRFGQSFS
ncbi:hypothetical protein CsatB_025693 [Cannabis sativa]